MANSPPVTVHLSVFFDGIVAPEDCALDEVRQALIDEIRGACKERVAVVLEKIGAKDVRVAFVAY